jgi:hypothetical protein
MTPVFPSAGSLPHGGGLVGWLRDLPPLHPARARAYARVFLVIALLVTFVRMALTGTGITPLGFAFHADTLSFWAASRLALSGHPEGAYQVAVHGAVQAPYDQGYYAFFYPPIYLLYCLPLGLLGFQAATAAFVGITGLAYWRVATWLLPGCTVAALAYPAVIVNALFGQNGFLTTALFGAAVLALPRRKLLAGAAFAGLCYKPQLAVLIPLALAAAREWRALAAMAVAVLALAAITIGVFGIGTWQAFLAELPLARHTLEVGLTNNAPWISVFRAVRSLGGSIAAASAIQLPFTLGALAAVAWACLRRRQDGIQAVLPVALFLFTPFVLAYDLVLLAVPAAWLLRRVGTGPFLPWEKTVLVAAFGLPMVTLVLGLADIPFAPVVLVPLLAVMLRRAALAG